MYGHEMKALEVVIDGGVLSHDNIIRAVIHGVRIAETIVVKRFD